MSRRKPKPKTNSRAKGQSNFNDEEKTDSYNRKGKGRNNHNAPESYAQTPELLRDAASYPFSYCTGATEVHDAANWNQTFIDRKPNDQIPGICTLHVVPTIGTAVNATDPINVAAQSVYSFVRHANSGSKNYDFGDLMIYILAMCNMFSFLVWCQRLYGYVLTYEQKNRYLPNDLIRTNNVDARDLVNNLANFRFWLNTLIVKLASFAVPATMSVFERMTFLYSDHYIEGTSIKEQLYQYAPEGWYEFGIDSDGLGELHWKPFDYTTLMTVADIMQYGDDLFNAIWSQEDFGIMSGDILKAYGSNIIKVAPIPEYYTIVPKFNPMVLTQMKNAEMIRVTINRILQDPNTGCLVQTLRPSAYTTSDTYLDGTAFNATDVTNFNAVFDCILKDFSILTVDTDDPTPDVVMQASRLKVAYQVDKNWYRAGTEVITHVVVTRQPGVDIKIEPIIATYNSAQCVYSLLSILEAERSFHYMPRIWVSRNTSANGKAVACIFDIDNFTVMNYEDVKKLHEAATINMFAVPSVGRITQ